MLWSVAAVHSQISSTMTGKSLLQNLLERNQLPVDDDEVYWPYLCLHGDDLRKYLLNYFLPSSGWRIIIFYFPPVFSVGVPSQVAWHSVSSAVFSCLPAFQ